MLLILTEKPSAARNFAAALSGMSGSYKGQTYKIFALRGHVLEFVDPNLMVNSNLTDKYKSWDPELLPWDLSDLKWNKRVKSGCEDILKNLKATLQGIEELVIATDNDPSGEGELLAWEALDYCGWMGKTSRMYFEDEAPKSIQKAFIDRKPLISMETDGDYVKAAVREKWDFCSMQFVRVATSLAKGSGFTSVVRQGRLKSVMVKLVGDQDKAWSDYVKKPYFEARFRDENGNIFARRVEDPSKIRFENESDVDLSPYHESSVVEDSRELKHAAPGKLLDLAGLSAILAKDGYKPENVLATYQKLYEDQIVSYPRTEDKTITVEQFNELLPLIDEIANLVGVDPNLLTFRSPRKTHISKNCAHGANRPGINVPNSLNDLSKYGPEAKDIYILLAKNYLAMLAADYEYELIKGHVAHYPSFVGETKVPRKAGFKAIFDSDTKPEDDENSSEFGRVAAPFVYEGWNKRPQRPTMKWLNKQLEKYNVGTGATRTSTLAEISKTEDKALLSEAKGTLTLTTCGKVSYVLLDGCLIASPEVTEKLFEAIALVGKFEEDPDVVLRSVNEMLVHDRQIMINNSKNLEDLHLNANTSYGVCPLCGSKVIKSGKVFSCSSNSFKKLADGTWVQTSGCGFRLFGFLGKTFSEKQIESLLAQKAITLKGCKSKTGKTFDCKVKLDGEGKLTIAEFLKSKTKNNYVNKSGGGRFK